jgi:hypothetical protein
MFEPTRSKAIGGDFMESILGRDSDAPSDGPGTHLKNWLKKNGLSGCYQCEALAQKMDKWGPVECRKKIDYLVNKVTANAMALKIIHSESIEGAVKLTVFKLLPSETKRKLVLDAIMKHGIESFEENNGIS